MNKSKRPVVDAAAIVPVYRDRLDEIRVVLVRRSAGGIHGGQLAFPGGKREPHDRSMEETALREAQEEIGISRQKVEILAPLPTIETQTTGFRIFPFLARISPPRKWHPDEREISEVIEVKLGELARPEAHGEEVMRFSTWSRPRRTPFYRVAGYQLWGVSYRILRPLIPRLLAGEWKL